MVQDFTSRISSVIAGSISGSLVGASIQPLDVVRTRMQGDAAKGVFRGPWNAAKTVFSEGGLPSLWRGSGPTVIRLSIGAGLHFFLLDWMKESFVRINKGAEISSAQNVAIGVVKTRMEYSQVGYKSTVDALVVISQREGVRGLFKGLAPTVLTSAPFSAFHYTFYRKLQELVQGSTNPSMATNFFCGTLAAMGATVLTHPGDVVRTRTQLGFGSLGALNTLKMIVETQGISGLMTGIIPRMAKRTLQTALIWTIYEEIAPKLRKALSANTST